jgi:hypothetical protein
VGGRGDPRLSAERVDESARERDADRHEQHSDGECEPDAVDAGAHGAGRVARAESPRHERRRRVGEEDEQADDRLDDDARDTQPGERHRAEVADEGRVGEQEEGFGHERPERREGEAADVAIEVPGHAPSLRPPVGAALRGCGPPWVERGRLRPSPWVE